MLRLVWALVAAIGLVMSMSTPAWADDVVYEKHTVVDFGDDTIDGNLTKPDGQYLESRKKQRHINLIRVRESFRPEILQSVRVL